MGFIKNTALVATGAALGVLGKEYYNSKEGQKLIKKIFPTTKTTQKQPKPTQPKKDISSKKPQTNKVKKVK